MAGADSEFCGGGGGGLSRIRWELKEEGAGVKEMCNMYLILKKNLTRLSTSPNRPQISRKEVDKENFRKLSIGGSGGGWGGGGGGRPGHGSYPVNPNFPLFMHFLLCWQNGVLVLPPPPGSK